MFGELITLVEELEGVISCHITGNKKIDEIHVIAGRDRDPKRIVRDIETVVLVNSQYQIDHKKISIAQISNEFKDSVANITGQRVELISIYCENNRDICHIKMLINDREVERSAEANFGEVLEKTIARGVLSLIKENTSFPEKLLVEDVFTINGKEDLLISQISVYSETENQLIEKLVGAVYVKNNLPVAIGKACLKALNRRLCLHI